MFHTSTVERFDISHWYCEEIRCFTLLLWRDSMFRAGTVERFDVSQWYCGEIRRFTMVLWRDSTFHNAASFRSCFCRSCGQHKFHQCEQHHVASIACVGFSRLLIQQQKHRLYFDPFCSPYLKQTVTEGITTSNGGQQRAKPIQYLFHVIYTTAFPFQVNDYSKVRGARARHEYPFNSLDCVTSEVILA